MKKKVTSLVFVFLLLVLVACSQEEETPTAGAPAAESPTGPAATEAVQAPEPADESAPPEAQEPIAAEIPISQEGVFISELLPGVPGGNNDEFIELYNTGAEAVDLNGWSLWYLLGEGQEETQVIAWQGPTDIPAYGHYLLVRSGKDFGPIPDATFDISLFEGKGGLILRDADGETIDSLGWGTAAEGFYAGSPASAPGGGASLERLPGGESGNGANTGDNEADFVANPAPNPQNSGSPMTPVQQNVLAIGLEALQPVGPGSEFELTVQVENNSGVEATNAAVSFPVPAGFTVAALPEGAIEEDGLITWSIDRIDDGQAISAQISLHSPFTYADALAGGYYAEADGMVRAYGPPQLISVAGGSIPIATARELIGSEVTVEGIATMYTGGFFAGTTGTKFYIEDESGGVQIYVPGGMGAVNVDIGDRVRVSGGVELYRDSIEVIPGDFTADIEILESGSAMPEPTPISITDNESNNEVIGQLSVIEGTATQIEEQTFDYQVNLTDAQGNTTLVLIEKDTGVTAEPLDLGQLYRVTGICEFYGAERQIKPRLQSDIVQVFPAILLLEMRSANSILPGEMISYTVTAYNHTPDTLNNLRITAQPPASGITVDQIQDGGVLEGADIVWTIDQLPGNGTSAEVHYTAIVDGTPAEAALSTERQESFFAPPATATADEWADPATSESFFTFIGSGVPIWAIQGDGAKSPYARINATTEGIVTGVFPEFQGFWLQELETDDDPATSAGLFVLVDGMDGSDSPVEPGDLVRVTGRVREISDQTTLHVTAPADIELLHAGTSPPAPVAYDPPQDTAEALAYNESLEGMLVTLGEPAVVVGPTTQYGEYALVNEHWQVDKVQRGEEAGFLIFVDDGSNAVHNDQSTLAYAVQSGDVVTNLSGPLAYTFGQHKIEPLATPEIETAVSELPTIDPAGPNELSIATFNVENLFDLLDPHPSSPPMPTLGEYRLKLGKLAEAIVAMGAPAIIGLQEVENIDILENLIEEEQIADLGYVPFLIEGQDSRGIDVGYLVRSDLVTVDGVTSYPAPEGLTSRPPLVISTTVHLDGGDMTLYLLNNHFLSLSEGEEATEPRRTAQAAWNAELVERIRAADPDGHIVVMGDLNSFYGTPPIDVLQEAGLRHAYEFFGDGETLPYTYIFQGMTQSLDHILFSDDLFAHLVFVDALHIDADYPIGDPDDATARHVSDHDPLIVVFSFSED